MTELLWIVIGTLLVIIVLLSAKIMFMQSAAKEISDAFAQHVASDTNTLIDISTRDKHMRKLANDINTQLRSLRSERHRFQHGDMELKNAVTNISHDLRTPLTAICGYLDLLEQEEKSEAVEQYINIIRNRTELLKQLTEELFRYSIIMTMEKEVVKESVVLNSVLEESIAYFYTSLKQRGIVPQIHIPEAPVIRTLDASSLSRVFSNLLSNAIKYSDGDLEITLSETGEINFTNTAAALDEVQIGRLFDRFYTVEDARKSTGLGLAIARTLIEQMGGMISATYEKNKLSISITFPDNTICPS